jgi:hypothetical protein
LYGKFSTLLRPDILGKELREAIEDIANHTFGDKQ